MHTYTYLYIYIYIYIYIHTYRFVSGPVSLRAAGEGRKPDPSNAKPKCDI